MPESVDHVLVRVDPKEDRTWLQSEPAVATDNAHALDKTGAPPLACFRNMQGFFSFLGLQNYAATVPGAGCSPCRCRIACHAVLTSTRMPGRHAIYLQSATRQRHFGTCAPACRHAEPHIDSPENWSEAVKRLKPRLLQRLADTLKMDSCLVFVRTNFDADNLEKFLNDLGATPPAACHR